jgi:RNA polymerase sigma-70 factor (ECF subfamily)
MHNDLLIKVKQNDVAAFQLIFDTYYSSLAYYAFKLVNDKSAAEDIVQEVFVNFWAKRQQWEITTSLSAYLYKAVKNSCLNHLKFRKVRTAYAEQTNFSESEDALIPEQIDAKHLEQLIESSLMDLPAARQRIFRLSREEGLKYREIADQLDISIKTVEAQMGKALKFMRERLKDFLIILFGICLSLIKNHFQ